MQRACKALYCVNTKFGAQNAYAYFIQKEYSNPKKPCTKGI